MTPAQKSAVTCAALDLTDKEWATIISLLEMNYECNEDPDSKSAADKLKAVESALKLGKYL